MATITRRLKDPLLYLEQVRQHLGRLPSIDPNTRTLLICGYPNVGKSSFLRSVTRADVDVQPYAFTTKSLFVGHFDYKYLRFQAIDTPGILDHPLEEMNTIEMQSITAIAHLRSAILYFMDLSEQCGYSVSAQIRLFQSIKPLFSNKLVFVVVNKIDIMRPDDLDIETKEMLQEILKPGDVELLQLSCTTSEGVMEVRNAACERLIADRVAQKLKTGTSSSGTIGSRLGDLLNRIHVARPMEGLQREVFIPDALIGRKRYDKEDPDRPKLERDIEEEEGGAGVYNIDLKSKSLSYPIRDSVELYLQIQKITSSTMMIGNTTRYPKFSMERMFTTSSTPTLRRNWPLSRKKKNGLRQKASTSRMTLPKMKKMPISEPKLNSYVKRDNSSEMRQR